MPYTEFGVVEKPIIDWLQELGWKYVNPNDMEALREADFEEPLVTKVLKDSLRKINSGIEFTDADLDYIVTYLRTLPSNVEGVRRFLDILKNGLVVPLQKEKKEKVIKLIDFERPESNSFIVTNQYKVHGSQGNIRADVVLLVNGIPLVVIECKNPVANKQDWLDAYKQIKRYEEQVPHLFKYVQLSLATDEAKTYYFPNAFVPMEEDFLNVWKDPYPFESREVGANILKITIYGLLAKSNLLDIVENFTFLRKERDRVGKITARYMQFRATNRIFQRVTDTLSGKSKEKFGLIWHWQGSGKTYTMAFSAWKLLRSPLTKNPSIFVVVDRKDLEEQIERDFSFIEIPLERIRSIKHLIEILTWGDQGKRGIFLVTIEKFSPKDFEQIEREAGQIKLERENVIVLADEVHRTQYGKFATLMRSVFKNAFIFGFTGTPLSKAERNTFQKFCPEGELYLDRYSMINALDDGFTVGLSYQARLPQYHLKLDQLEALQRFEEEEIEGLTPEERKALQKKVRPIREFLEKEERIQAIAEDIVEHFNEVVAPTGLKGMIVTYDREACIKYKKALDGLLDPSESEIVMTNDPNKPEIRSYFDQLRKKYGKKSDKEIHNEIIDRFASRVDPKILIVTDMLITGFDAPNLWVMYLDKPLREHRILQAIARTNRPFRNKKFGLIVDYIGALKELEKAFEKFEARDARDLRAVIRDLTREKEEFVSLLKDCMSIFQGVKREDSLESLEAALDRLIDPETAKKFEDLVKKLMKSYEMLAGEPFLRDFLKDYTWLVQIYVAYNKKFKRADVDELKIERLSRKTAKLIQDTVEVKKIDDSYPVVTIDKNYIEALRKTPPKDISAAIDVLASIRHEAKAHPESPFFRSLVQAVEQTLEELRTRKIDTEEAVRRITTFSKHIVEWKRKRKEIGADKYPYYEVIKSVIPDSDDQKVIKFVSELLERLHSKDLLFKGWQQQRDVRRKIKSEIKLLLLARLKDYRNRVDQLKEEIFNTLEEME